jgi:hypothetical protein
MAVIGWGYSFRILAVLLVLLLIPTMYFREPVRTITSAKNVSGTPSFWRDWSALFSQPAMRFWLPVLLTYKLADALGSSMIKPLLIDNGFSLKVVGEVGMVSAIASLLAAFVGGLLCRWLGTWRALFYGGLLQAIGLGLYAVVALGVQQTSWIYGISMFEQMADAMSTVTLFAAMMGYCRAGHEGSDYTLQMAAFTVLSGTVSLAGGAIASQTGFPLFFLGSAALGIGSLYFVWQAYQHALAKRSIG